MDMNGANAGMTSQSQADPFCYGPGYVMNSGFQLSKGGYCMLFLFQDAVVATATKYGFALVGTLLFGIVVEMLRLCGAYVSQRRLPWLAGLGPTAIDAVVCALFALQMTVAYWLMLLVMIYEYVVFIFVVLGLTVGHFIALRIQRAHPIGAKGSVLPVTGSPCCADSNTLTQLSSAPNSHLNLLHNYQQAGGAAHPGPGYGSSTAAVHSAESVSSAC